MSEEKAMAIAENADIVLNGYAVTRDSENFRVVNLRTGKAAERGGKVFCLCRWNIKDDGSRYIAKS